MTTTFTVYFVLDSDGDPVMDWLNSGDMDVTLACFFTKHHAAHWKKSLPIDGSPYRIEAVTLPRFTRKQATP